MEIKCIEAKKRVLSTKIKFMTVEELLKPRIKCVEPFLGMQRQGWEVGVICTAEENEDYLFITSLPKRFPLNFKLLDWWEEREEKDMPKYLKFRKPSWKYQTGDVVETIGWQKQNRKFNISHNFFEPELFFPATEKEFKEYK